VMYSESADIAETGDGRRETGDGNREPGTELVTRHRATIARQCGRHLGSRLGTGQARSQTKPSRPALIIPRKVRSRGTRCREASPVGDFRSLSAGTPRIPRLRTLRRSARNDSAAPSPVPLPATRYPLPGLCNSHRPRAVRAKRGTSPEPPRYHSSKQERGADAPPLTPIPIGPCSR
jgi:hypothetical protein